MPDHAVAVGVRWVHVAAMGLLLGGAVLATLALASDRARAPRATLRAYEWTYWAAAGAAVLTGVGNLGAFGRGLPGPGTRWGLLLAAKLGLVLVLLAASLPRTLLAARVPDEGPVPPRLRRVLLAAYGLTIAILALVSVLAVVMAHG